MYRIGADDGKFSFTNSTLTTKVTGSFEDINPLANITIAGWKGQSCRSVQVSVGGKEMNEQEIKIDQTHGKVLVRGLSSVTSEGAFARDLVVKFE
jgi:alpha-glucosidase